MCYERGRYTTHLEHERLHMIVFVASAAIELKFQEKIVLKSGKKIPIFGISKLCV